MFKILWEYHYFPNLQSCRPCSAGINCFECVHLAVFLFLCSVGFIHGNPLRYATSLPGYNPNLVSFTHVRVTKSPGYKRGRLKYTFHKYFATFLRKCLWIVDTFLSLNQWNSSINNSFMVEKVKLAITQILMFQVCIPWFGQSTFSTNIQFWLKQLILKRIFWNTVN